MVARVYKQNAQHIQADLEWLKEIIRRRYAERQSPAPSFKMPNPPALKGESVYQSLLKEFKFTAAERLALLLSLIPHIAPYFLDEAWQEVSGSSESALRSMPKTGTVPTIDFFLYLLAGDDLERRFQHAQIFDDGSFLVENRILIHEPDSSVPELLQPIRISPDYLSMIVYGKEYKPRFTTAFPAKRLTTSLAWKDLVLNDHVSTQVSEIMSWIQHGKTILQEWDLGKRLSPGYKILFYGPPGTGKTMTAALIGKESGVDVYRIDLSMVVSKYIGETEKNLARIFDEANHKDWILFFDEADALFGKRTEMKDAHDRFANQEVAFLLQKIEDHNGVVILSSNMKSNIDDAFTRRFQGIVYFPMPTAEERLKIWENGFSKKSVLDKTISLQQIADKYEMSGGAIMNVIRYASLKALERRKNIIDFKDLINGIAREFAKEGRTI